MIKHVNNEKLLKLAGKDETYDEPLDLFFFFFTIPSSTYSTVELDLSASVVVS